MPRKHSLDHNAPSPPCTLPAIVTRCLFSDVSRRIRQRPSVRWSIKCGSSEKATCHHLVDVQLRYWHANFSLRRRWTAVSIGALTRRLLRRPIRSNVRWTVVEETLLVTPWFIWAVSCSTVARLFARTHLRSRRSPLSSMARGAPHLPRRQILEMLPPLARKPMIMPFSTSDKSTRFCITPTIAIFYDSRGRPLYTLHCNVLPPAFCDWLFHVDVESRWWSH
jgi:hypothetical protein